MEIPGATFDASYDLTSDTIETANIVGRLPGTTHANETVLYTAHWYHIGIGSPDANGDAIFNGAVDNATGTAALIELARLYGSGPRPERSIVLIGFTAEESGLLGSEFYAANPIYDPALTVAGFNIDGMNVLGRMTDVSVTGSGYSSLELDLARHAALQGRTVSADTEPQAGYYFRSDHFPLAKRGIPMLYADGGTALRIGGAAAVEAAKMRLRPILMTSLAFTLAVILGTSAAYAKSRIVDRLVTMISLIGVSVPHFWLAIVLVIIFAVELNFASLCITLHRVPRTSKTAPDCGAPVTSTHVT